MVLGDLSRICDHGNPETGSAATSEDAHLVGQAGVCHYQHPGDVSGTSPAFDGIPNSW